MKKKIKARDLREAKKQEKLAAFSAKENNVKDNTPTDHKSVEAVSTVLTSDTVGMKKSVNKAAGLKSTLIDGKCLYLTSFGKGNNAVVEHKIATDESFSVKTLENEPSLKVKDANEKAVAFLSTRPFVRDNELSAVNPLHFGKDKPEKEVGRDMLGLKSELEKRYFGKSFDDNLHIQIIHNILDIEKIIAVYATNITAAIDHMVDGDNDQYLNSDFIGYMNTLNTYEVFMKPFKNPKLDSKACKNIENSRTKFEYLLDTKRLGYFGFEYDKKSKDKRKQEDIKKRLYHLIAFAGQLRQWSFHSIEGLPRTWLYQLDNTKLDQEYRDTLDFFFNERFDEINENFVIQNATNLYILKEVFSEKDIKNNADLYYDFIVIKSQKNMGFSIKKLRDKMLEIEGAERIKEQDMDSVRSKLYKLIDFCIFKYYHELPEICEKNVDILRAAVTETEKEEFYSAESTRLWSVFSERFLGFCDKIVSWSEKKKEHEEEMISIIDQDAYRNKSEVSYFSKLLYAMSFFLDGKEINDLLTTLINKFDNIRSFIDTADFLNIDVTFVKEYDFFNKSRDYVGELNIIKNIARMKKPAASAKKEMYRDALTILGIPTGMSDDQLDTEIKKILEKKINPVTGKTEKGKNPFRNFIANNVIENTRFIYVIKFCNPENVRKLVNNMEITKFVLRRMPETQIDRYYSSCIVGDLNPTTENKIKKLAEMIKDMKFDEFRNVKQKTNSREEAMEKERFKAIIGLYLTVVYLLVKNLVNINSRYVMAFHCLERDAKLYGVQNIDKDYLALTAELCAEGDEYGKKLLEAKQNNTHDKVQMPKNYFLARNKRLREAIEQDIGNANKWFIGEKFNNVKRYRNNVAHLTAVRNCAEFIGDISKIDSYFALYHYLIQRQLAVGLDPERPGFEKNFPQYALLFKWHTYVKDMVKALNAPFGYNIPRFKNLSIDALFDRNEMKEVSDDGKCQELDK